MITGSVPPPERRFFCAWYGAQGGRGVAPRDRYMGVPLGTHLTVVAREHAGQKCDHE